MSLFFTFQQKTQDSNNHPGRDSHHTCFYEVESNVVALCYDHLAAGCEFVQNHAAVHRDEKQEGEEVCMWTCVV